MSASALRKEIHQAHEWVSAHGKPVLRRTWPAFGILLLIPGASGALGGTPKLSEVNGVSIIASYEKETHVNQPTVWQVEPLAGGGTIRTFKIRINKENFNHLSLTSIEPAPATTTDGGYEMIYDFKTSTSTIDFILTPTSLGKTAATIQYGVDTPIAFSVTTLL